MIYFKKTGNESWAKDKTNRVGISVGTVHFISCSGLRNKSESKKSWMVISQNLSDNPSPKAMVLREGF